MYLQYKYGDQENGDWRDGDPEKSLAKFHAILQKQAIEEFKSKNNIDPDHWARMLRLKFPRGLFAIDYSKIDDVE
jgi:hypothetical protein